VQKLKNSNLEKQLLLYAVTDNAWLGKQTLAEQVEAALKGGVTMLQLREKHMADADFLKEALAIKKLTSAYNVPLIINDNLEVALQCDADGLHIGQDDCSVEVARKALGNDKILGVSAQTIEQAKAAEAAGADYLGVGAVFATATKDDAVLVGPENLAAICQAVKIPVVAIGGITKENLPSLLPSGIAGVALVSAIFAQPDITAACQELLNIIKL
jgi:thiamine-phosphate pyrophosphorylase